MGEGSDQVRVGICGAGIIGGIHAANLAQLPDLRVVCVADIDLTRARAMAARTGARPEADPVRMVEEEDMDALFICLPPFARDDLVQRAIRRGLHVYVEKPVGLDLDATVRTLENIERSGIIAGAGYMWRYAPVVTHARSVLNPAHHMALTGRMLNTPNTPAWSLDRALSGGLIVEFATHLIDLLRYLGGEVISVSGAGTGVMPGPPARGPDCAFLTLRLESGSIASLEASWAHTSLVADVQVRSATAELHLNLNPETLGGTVSDQEIDLRSPTPRGVIPHGFTGGPSWYLAVAGFIDAVRASNDSALRASYREGVRTLAVTLAADEAIRTGETVDVPRI